MTTNLTEPISKKLLFAMLVVTIGAEVLLYLTRYSTLASTLYDAVMVSSFFIGWKLHRRLKSQQGQDYPKSRRQLTLQFTGAFLIFFFGSTLINVYSNITFQDFSEDYDQFVQDYSDNQTYDAGDDGALPAEPVWSFFEKVDTIGYDLYTDSLAGLEEVWRLAYMILLLMVCKKVFPRRWESGARDVFLMAALFITSILFGIDHTLDTAQPWDIRIGAIVTFANMGFLFGIILLWTRNLWLTVLVHALYDITATLSWYYVDYAVEYFTLGVVIVHMCLLTLEKINKKQLKRISQEVQREEMTQNIE